MIYGSSSIRRSLNLRWIRFCWRVLPGSARVASVLDLGTGAGVIPLWLTGYRGVERVTGLEIQPEVAALARENVKLNGLEERIRILTGDLRTPPPVLAAGSFDWVLSNPPYWPATTHLLPEGPALAQAKFELTCTLRDVVAAAAHLCRDGGRVGLIHLPERLTDPPQHIRHFKLEPKRLCLVQPKPGVRPHRVLVEAQKLARPGLKSAGALFDPGCRRKLQPGNGPSVPREAVGCRRPVKARA